MSYIQSLTTSYHGYSTLVMVSMESTLIHSYINRVHMVVFITQTKYALLVLFKGSILISYLHTSHHYEYDHTTFSSYQHATKASQEHSYVYLPLSFHSSFIII